jgi:hypothetical protein
MRPLPKILFSFGSFSRRFTVDLTLFVSSSLYRVDLLAFIVLLDVNDLVPRIQNHFHHFCPLEMAAQQSFFERASVVISQKSSV